MNLTIGHVARHTPSGSGAQGREAALIDIAQDLLLSNLYERGFLDKLALKGGTGIRKLYAGNEGRFSIDLDFAVSTIDTNLDDVALEFIGMVDGLQIEDFIYSVSERRGKWYIGFRCQHSKDEILKTKLDFASAPWTTPVRRGWVPMPIHEQYDNPLPQYCQYDLKKTSPKK